ncbi:MAG: class I SAM-dependent methyltransferase [Patescibacteria group bacterium]
MTVPFEYITTITERIPPPSEERHVFLPALTKARPPSEEFNKWTMENWWMYNLSVHYRDKPEAQTLALELERVFAENEHHPRIAEILTRLREIESTPVNRMTSAERWNRTARGLADDIGGGSDKRGKLAKRLSKRYSGVVLEALCGFNSYLLSSSDRTVIALDYSREALERYPYPDRTRICADLNTIGRNEHLPFEYGYFDAITVCFGFRYPVRIRPVLQEFHRILKKGTGILSFIENPYSGYEDLCKRRFDPKTCGRHLRAVGFKVVRITPLSALSDPRVVAMGNVDYHVEAFC